MEAEEQPATEAELLDKLRQGDGDALGGLFDLHRERLWRMVTFRMDRRLRARVDADDVLQESYVSARQRIQYFHNDADHSIFVWLRLIVGQTLVDVHRRHLGAEMRDVSRDVSLQGMRYPRATSASIAVELLGSMTSPSQAAARAETTLQLEQAIGSMSEIDQEIIALRHFEDLTNNEVAEVLHIGVTAASNRYIRAIGRLKSILDEFSDFRIP